MLRLARLFLGKPDPLATAQARLHVAKEARHRAWLVHRDAVRRNDSRDKSVTRRALNKAESEMMRAEMAVMAIKRGRAPRMEMAR